MPSPNAALSGTDLTNLRAGLFTLRGYLSIVPDTSIATARLNQTVFADTLAELTVDTTSGWSNVKPDMLVKIGTTAGASDVYVGRVRETPGATTLYLSQFSEGDPGLITKSATVALADNQYVTICESYHLFSVFPRLYYNGTNYVFYKDYNVAFDQQTGSKKPAILNIGDHTAGRVNSGTSVLTDSRTANVTVFGAETVSSYLWTIGDGTLTVGTLASQSITATYPPGARVITCTVTLSTGAVMVAQRNVIAHDDSSYPALEVMPSSWRKTRQQSSITLELTNAFNAGLRNNAMCIYWEEISFNGQTISTAINQMVGWVEGLSGDVEPGLATVSFTLVNALSILSKTTAYAQRLEYAASPASWIESNLMHLDWFTFYLLYFQSTLLNLFDFYGTNLTSYTADAWRVERGNLTNQANRMLESINSELCQLPNGALYIRRNPVMMGTTDRAGVVERLTLGEDDLTSADIGIQVRNVVGKVEGNAFSTGTSTPTPYRADGYGTVDGQGAGISRLDNQRVSGQSELNERVSNKLAEENNPYPSMRVGLATGGYFAVIEPALWYFVPINIPAALSPTGSALALRCIPLEVSASYQKDAQGNYTREVSLSLAGETSGIATPGETVAIPVSPFDFDPITGLPIWEYDSLYGGGLGLPEFVGMPPLIVPPVDIADLGTSESLRWFAWNTILVKTLSGGAGSVDWDDIVLTGNMVSAIRMGATRVMAITDSRLYDITAITTTPVATLRQTISNMRLLRKVAGLANAIGIYLANTGNATINDAFTSGLGTKTAFTSATFPFYKYVAGEGQWISSGGISDNGGCIRTTDTGANPDSATVFIDLGAVYTITAASMAMAATEVNTSWGWIIRAWDATKTHVAYLVNSFNNFSQTSYVTRSWTGSQAGVRYISYNIDINITGGNYGKLDDISITYTGETVQVKFSDDGGIGIDSTQNVGVYNAGEFGYDVDDFNLGVHLAAAGGAVEYSSTYIGAFTALVGLSVPVASTNILFIRFPYLRVSDSALNDTAAALEFIYGVGTLIGGASIFLVTFNSTTGAVASETDITPIIAATTYLPVSGAGNQFVTYGGNARRMLLFAQPSGGGSTVLLGSTDGGVTWAIKNTGFNGTFVDFIPPDQDGNGLKCLVAGADGVGYSTNFGTTITGKNGDLATETGAATALGIGQL